MHLKATSLKLLLWQPEGEKSLLQFLLLDNYLELETFIRSNISFIGLIIITNL